MALMSQPSSLMTSLMRQKKTAGGLQANAMTTESNFPLRPAGIVTAKAYITRGRENESFRLQQLVSAKAEKSCGFPHKCMYVHFRSRIFGSSSLLKNGNVNL